MKITGVSVEGVGKFGAPTRVEGFGDGVNILAAGNEAGKSTLFRAFRACLFKRHGATDKEVKMLATDGLSLPVSVTLEFEHDGAAYALSKSFLKSADAVLRRDGQTLAKGREADDKTLEILGLRAGAKRNVDEGAFGLLWVGQRDSFEVKPPTGDAGDLLSNAVQNEVGELVGGDRARTVLAALSDELGKQLTSTGRPKKGGDLDSAETAEKDLQQELEAAETKLRALNQQIDELQRKRAEHGRLADPAELARSKSDSEKAAQERAEAQKAAEALHGYARDEKLAAAQLRTYTDKLQELAKCAERIDRLRQRQSDMQAERRKLEEQQRTAVAATEGTRTKRETLRKSVAAHERRSKQLEQAIAARSKLDGRQLLQSEVEDLQSLQEELSRLQPQLGANAATEEAVESLRAAEQDTRILEATVEAAAPEVEITLGSEAGGQVAVDGTAIDASRTQPAVSRLTVRVGEIATITVTPKGEGIKQDRERLEQQRRTLREALVAIGFDDPTAAYQARGKRKALEEQERQALSDLKARGVKKGAPAGRIAELKAEIEQLDATVQAALCDLQQETLPDATQIEAEQSQVGELLQAARSKIERLDEEIRRGEQAAAEIDRKLALHEGEWNGVEGRLTEDLTTLPDAARGSRIEAASQARAAAETEHRRKAAALEARREQTPSADQLDSLNRKADRLAEALENRSRKITQLDKEIAGLEGSIQSAGGDGIGERVEDLRQQLELASADRAVQQARVDALSLLKTTIEECYAEQRERLHAPLHRHLTPFLSDLFPAGRLELGEEFAVTGLRRNGAGAEEIERLSDGTQEQIAVLVRLAMGSLLAEQGHEAPIILDDALVFSDDDRIEKMFDALKRAGEKQQVIVLTCRTRTFSTLGGRQLSIVSES